MRIVHLTDLHYVEPVSPARLLSKRVLGWTNLVLRRRGVFGGAAREQVVGDALAREPDLVVVSGDLTTLALPAEFATARAALEPILEAVPTVVLAGNHDRYTRGATRDRRVEATFGAWMRGGRWDDRRRAWRGGGERPPFRYDLGPLTVLALDTARPHPLSRGRLGAGQRARLEQALDDCHGQGRAVLLALHYPLLTDSGAPYRHPGHGLAGVEALLETLRRRPPLAVLHGHDHHHRLNRLAAAGGHEIPVVNGGSSGLAPRPGRDPGYYVLDWEPDGVLEIRRRRFAGGRYGWQPVASFTRPPAAPASEPAAAPR